MVQNKVEKKTITVWFILRTIAYLINKAIALYLMIQFKETMPRVWIFVASSVFDLFIIGELNIKPVTASANLEIKK